MEQIEKVEKAIRTPSELPNGWKKAPLVEIADIIMGQSPSSEYYNADRDGLPFFQGKAEFGDLYPEPVKWCSQPSKVAQKEDILISVRAPVGPTNLAPSECCIGRGLAAIRPRDGIPSRYLLYYLRNIESSLDELGTGTTFKAISGKVLHSIPVPVAPPEQQKRIVAEIEKQFSRLDEAVANLKRVKANLKRYKAAVLKAAVEGKLTEEWRKAHPDVEPASELLKRILTERRQKWTGRSKYKEPGASVTTQLPALPDGYTWATFGQLCRIQGGFAFKSGDYVKEGIPLVRISNLVNGRVQLSQDIVFLPESFASEYPEFQLRKGDVLIAMSGATTGKMATMGEDTQALLNQRVGRFVLSSARLCSGKFISFLVEQISQKVLKDAYGAAQPNISPTEIEAMPVPFPPLTEQERIVAELERRLSVVEELETVVEANFQRATRLRQSILQCAFEGR